MLDGGVVLGRDNLAYFFRHYSLLFFCALSSCVYADVYKCIDVDGHVTYKNHKTEGLECRTLSGNMPISSSTSKKMESSKSTDETTKKLKKQPEKPSQVFTGTAFAISDKLMISNAHVVSGCKRIQSKNPDAVLSIKAIDKAIDLALLQTSFSMPAHVSIRKTPPKVGEDVFLAGFPLVGILGQSLSFTKGIVSSSDAFNKSGTHFTHTAPTQPGNSGGPIFDSYGRLVGVVVGKLNDTVVMGLTGSIPQNVNFGITNDALRGFMNNKTVGFDAATSSALMQGEALAEMASKVTVVVYCLTN
jgi:S1-C subfamily serine protease